MTDTVETPHFKNEHIRRLADAFVRDVPDELERARVRGYLWGTCGAEHDSVIQEFSENPREERILLAEIAFWRGLYEVIRKTSEFVIADKIGFVPPRVEKIIGE